MQYYQFHIGDYVSATAHLSPLEDLAYRRMLDLYYSSENPLPTDIPSLTRRLRVSADDVQNVLREFFELREDGYHNSRCDEEISRFLSWVDTQRENGRKGGRRKKQPQNNPLLTHGLPIANPSLTHGQATHNPLPSTHNPVPKEEKEVRKRFIIPSVEEVAAYCIERGNTIDPQKFHDYNESKGWKVGNSPMKDWKAAVRTWEKNSLPLFPGIQVSTAKPVQPASDYQPPTREQTPEEAEESRKTIELLQKQFGVKHENH
jgi:uncharacterized protein YdaU (DUF1376 family)